MIYLLAVGANCIAPWYIYSTTSYRGEQSGWLYKGGAFLVNPWVPLVHYRFCAGRHIENGEERPENFPLISSFPRVAGSQAGPQVMGLCARDLERQQGNISDGRAANANDRDSGSAGEEEESTCVGLASEIPRRGLSVRTRFIDDFFEDCTMSKGIKQVKHSL